jgi:predicted O-methyltransferase YrrM
MDAADLLKSQPPLLGLFDIVYGVSRAHLFEAGILSGVFDHLSDWATAAETAESVQSNPGSTMSFLDGLVALDLLEKDSGRYRNTPVASAYFVKGLPTYLGDFFLNQLRMLEMPAENLKDIVFEGPQQPASEKEESAEFWGELSRQYANYMRAGISAFQSDLVRTIPELAEPARILDIGGGPGLTAIALAHIYPMAEVVVFEQPGVARVAQEMFRLYGMEDRVSTLAGDYMTDALGEEYDLIFASFTLNYARDCLDTMAEKIRDALAPGGIFVSVADGLTHERTSPADYVISMLPWAITGQVAGFDRGELRSSLEKSGLEVLRSFEVDSPHGPVDIDIVRKRELS